MQKHLHQSMFIAIIITFVFYIFTVMYRLQEPDIRICNNHERTEYLNRKCNELNFTPSQLRGGWVDHDKKLIYCAISKASGSTWKYLWQSTNLNNNQLKLNGIHSHKLLKIANITHIKFDNLKKVENYTTFTVIRHPFDRVLSAYYNTKRSVKYMEEGQYGPTKKVLGMTNNDTLSLSDFIKIVTNDSSPYYRNTHWTPYSETCSFCDMNYDHIIKVETMSQSPVNDASIILEKLGYSRNYLSQFQINKGIRSDDQTSSVLGQKVLAEFKTVPFYLIKRLLIRYKYDLNLFGYYFDANRMTTYCRIPGENGDICC